MKWIDLLETNLKNSEIRKLMKKYYSLDEVYLNFSKLDDSIKKELEYARIYKNLDKELRIISYHDEEYPLYLKEIKDFPVFLFVKGLKIKKSNFVGVIGTRKSTTLGEKICQKVITGLASYDNIAIVSGMAKGIDSVAHRFSIENGIYTIAVLPTNIYDCYPKENELLKQDIQKFGTIITEFRTNEKLNKWNFVVRNRIIAGISRLIYIPQTYANGGSLITAKFASMYDREIYASPGNIFDESFAGCNDLIVKNKAKLIRDASDIAYEYGWRKKSEEIFGNSRITI